MSITRLVHSSMKPVLPVSRFGTLAPSVGRRFVAALSLPVGGRRLSGRSRRPVLAPATEVGDVAVVALGHLPGEEDPGNASAVGEPDGTAVQDGRLAGLDARPDVVGHVVDLAGHRHAAGPDLEHPGMYV